MHTPKNVNEQLKTDEYQELLTRKSLVREKFSVIWTYTKQ